MSFQLDTAVKNQHKSLSNPSPPHLKLHIVHGVRVRIRWWGWVGVGPCVHGSTWGNDTLMWFPICNIQKTGLLASSLTSINRYIFLLSHHHTVNYHEERSCRYRRLFVQGDIACVCGSRRPAVLLFLSICCTLTCLSHCCQPHVPLPILTCLTPLYLTNRDHQAKVAKCETWVWINYKYFATS